MHSDYLVYQEKKGGIFVKGEKNDEAETLVFNGETVLLGMDEEDNIYAGRLDKEQKVNGIAYGNAGDNTGNWRQFPLVRAVKPEELVIAPGGAVYIIDEAAGSLTGVMDGVKIYYKGRLLKVLRDYIVSMEKNTVKLKHIDISIS